MAEEKKDSSCSCSCSCSPGGIQANDVFIFPCNGGSNLGQIANQAGVKLAQGGMGNVFCLPGIGARVDQIIDFTGTAKVIVGIDGCSFACSKKILEDAGFFVDEYVQVSDLGVQKNKVPELDPPPAEVKKVVDHLAPRIKKKMGA